MKTVVAMLAISCVLSLGIAQTFGAESVRPGIEQYLLEGLGGLAGLGVGAACGVAASYGVGIVYAAVVPNAGWDALGAAFVSLLVCGAALPACAGCGVNLASGNSDNEGANAGAYIGAYAGLPLAIGIGVLGNVMSGHNSTATITAAAIGTLAVPAGAVVGHNWQSGREPELYGARLKGRIGMPLVMLDQVERTDRGLEYGVRVQLASVRF